MVAVVQAIYCEASPTCTQEERWLVASVLKNRINNPAFASGRLRTMLDVVRYKSTISKSRFNLNYRNIKTSHPAWIQAKQLGDGKFTPYPEVVFYHDKSISRPVNWGKYWKPVVVRTTEHFVFYKIVRRV